MPLIPAPQLHLWLCQTTKLSPAYLQQAQTIFLDEKERERFTRYKFEKHKTAFLASRILLKTGLHYYLGGEIADIAFTYNAFGKPEIIAEQNPTGIHFNLTHSDDYILLAVYHSALGIDTENLDRKANILNIARHNFHPKEIFQLENAPNQIALGFYFWMLKEAYIKYIGKGLSQRLTEFYFERNQQELIFGFDNQPHLKLGAALLEIAGRCTAAICYNGGEVEWHAKEVSDFGNIQSVPVSIMAQTSLQHRTSLAEHIANQHFTDDA